MDIWPIYSYFALSIDRWLIDSYFWLSILILDRHEPDGPPNGTFLGVQNAPEDVKRRTKIGAKDLASASGLEDGSHGSPVAPGRLRRSP
jgi:hypothetical protein